MQQILFRMASEKGSNAGDIGQDCKYWPGCYLRRVQMLQILARMASEKASNVASISQDGI